jgi:CheY-like chemotaxis protein
MPTHRLLLAAQDPDLTRISDELCAAGYRVDSASDGRQAAALATVTRYDVILMALQLPLVDGLNAARAMREDEDRRRQPNVPIVGLASDAPVDARQSCVRSGMSDCVSLRLSRGELLTTVARWITSSGSDGIDSYLADILPGYLTARRGEAVSMRAALTSGSYDTIVAIAHRLRGTGGTYGRQQLSAIGGALEAAARAGDADVMARCLDALDEELGK